ncbi:hypothetical protein VNO80_11691 [Phaseolus coccineus]|uniref:Uncharacterized protein n=1 Tax=Phaseolus coccineus TaxID=3886 RepID=A0AAN9RFQ7_PHACN
MCGGEEVISAALFLPSQSVTCRIYRGPVRIGVKFSSPTTPPFFFQLATQPQCSFSISLPLHRLVTGNEPSFSDRLYPLLS